MMNATAQNRSALMIEAVAAARLGQKGLARRLFNEIVEKDPGSEQALLWLAALADTPDESVRALEQVLVINPNNQQALSALAVQKMHQTAKPAEVPLPPPPSSRALPAGPFGQPGRLRAVSVSDPSPIPSAPQPAGDETGGSGRVLQFQRAIRRVWNCPMCKVEHPEPVHRCTHCGCYLALEDLWQIADNRGADEEILAKALEHWTQKLNEEPFEAHLNVARALLGLNRSAEALPHLQKACALREDAAEIRTFTETLKFRKLIVAVDDSQTVRKLVSVSLERKGYRVLTVADGVLALAKLEDFRPDLVLLDISLPKVDGYEICRILRKHEGLKGVPVVMLSGKDGFFDKVKGKIAGANDYLTKPFDVVALSKVLEKHLGPKSGGAAK
jgi:twitching motility two-component system response regulator PilG